MFGTAVRAGEERVLADGLSARRCCCRSRCDRRQRSARGLRSVRACSGLPWRPWSSDRSGRAFTQPRFKMATIARLFSRRVARRSSAGRPRISSSILLRWAIVSAPRWRSASSRPTSPSNSASLINCGESYRSGDRISLSVAKRAVLLSRRAQRPASERSLLLKEAMRSARA